MILFRHDLWSHIGRGSTKSVYGVRRHRLNTKTKVNKFQLFVSIKEDVLSLYVSVHDVSLMQIF